MNQLQDLENFEAAEIVQKANNSGFLSNQRLLVIKSGMLYYYSKVPKQFKDDVKILESNKEFPKSSIQIRNILNIKSTKKPEQLTITFQKENMYQRKEIMRRSGVTTEQQLNSPKKSDKNKIQWTFTFKTPQKQKFWAISLQKLKQYYKKENYQIEKFFENFTDKKILQSRRSSQILQSPIKNKSKQSRKIESEASNTKGLNVIQQQKEQNKQQEELEKELKFREQKYKRELEQKLRKQYQIKFELQKEKEQRQKQRLFEQRESQIKKLQQQLRKKIQQEQIKRKEIELRQQQLKKVQQLRILQMQKKEQQQKLMEQKLTNQKMPQHLSITSKQNYKGENKQQNNKAKQQSLKILQQKQLSRQQKSNLPKNDNFSINKEQNFNQEIKTQSENNQFTIRKITHIESHQRLQNLTKEKSESKSDLKPDILKRSPSAIIPNSFQNKKNQKNQKKFDQTISEIVKNNGGLLKSNDKIQSSNKIGQRDDPSHKTKQQIKQKKSQELGPKNQNIIDKIEDVKLVTKIQKADPQQNNKNQQIQAQDNPNLIQQIKTQIQQPSQNQNDRTQLKQLKQDYMNQFENNIIGNNQIQQLNFFQLQSEMFKLPFEQKIKKQILLLQYVKSIKNNAVNIFKNIVTERELPEHQRKYEVYQNNYNDQDFTISFGFCETNLININGKQQYVYNENYFKKFKRIFQIYQQIQNKIMVILKKKSYFTLRVPLVFYVQYRGVCGLIIYWKNIVNQKIKLEQSNSIMKQLNLIVETENVRNFELKNYKSKNNIHILWVKQSYKLKKSKDIQFNSPITPQILNKKSKISFSNKNLRNIKSQLIQNPTPQNLEKIECLQILQYCKNIRKVYRAGQAQLNDHIFLKLVFQKDINIHQMLQSNLSSNFPNKGIILQYLKEFLGIDIELEYYNKQDINLSTIRSIRIHCITLEYRFEALQLTQIIDNFDKYLKENKLVLAQKSLDLQKSICDPNSNEQIKRYIINKINLLFYKKQYQQCIKQANLLKHQLSYTSISKLKCYQILFNSYKLLWEHNNFISTIRQAIEYFQFVFGNHTYLVTLYYILANYLGLYGYIDQALEFYKYTLNLSNQINTNEQLNTEIYIEMSKIYMSSKNSKEVRQLLNEFLEQFKKINKNSLIEAKLNAHVSTVYYFLGKQQQGEKYLKKAIAYFQIHQKLYKEQLQNCYLLLLKYYQVKKNLQYLPKITSLIKINSEKYSKYIQILFVKYIKKISHQKLQSVISRLQNNLKNQLRNSSLKSSSILNQNLSYDNLQGLFNQLIIGENDESNKIIKIIGETKLIQILKATK